MKVKRCQQREERERKQREGACGQTDRKPASAAADQEIVTTINFLLVNETKEGGEGGAPSLTFKRKLREGTRDISRLLLFVSASFQSKQNTNRKTEKKKPKGKPTASFTAAAASTSSV